MDLKGKFEAARQAGQDTLDEKTNKAIEEQWPKIQQLFQEKVGPAALAAGQDNAKMETAFKLVYMALPFPVQMVIKQDAFVKFCFEHRDRLLPSGQAGVANA
jgi:hypothetical protein